MFASSIFMDFKMGALSAELMAIFEGMKVSKSLGCSKLLVEFDCLVTINFLNKKTKVWKEVEATVELIWYLASDFREIFFQFITRRFNRVAHEIAKSAIFCQRHVILG